MKRFGKVVLGIVIVLVVFCTYEYQKPIMTSGEATKQAILCLNNPPRSSGIKPIHLTLDDLQSVHTDSEPQSGFFNKLTNNREWIVTLIFKKGEPTVTMNAYNGKCIGISGPLS